MADDKTEEETPSPKEKIYLLTESQLAGIINTYEHSTFPAKDVIPAIRALRSLQVHYDPDTETPHIKSIAQCLEDSKTKTVPEEEINS